MKLPAHFTGFGSKSDGSAGLRFSTQELTSQDFAELKVSLNSFGWLIFAPTEENIELPKESITDDTKKPSQRLRGVLYVLWRKLGNSQDVGQDFESWYRGQIELIIDKVKAKLE